MWTYEQDELFHRVCSSMKSFSSKNYYFVGQLWKHSSDYNTFMFTNAEKCHIHNLQYGKSISSCMHLMCHFSRDLFHNHIIVRIMNQPARSPVWLSQSKVRHWIKSKFSVKTKTICFRKSKFNSCLSFIQF